jgi:metallo-beta-lactamase class B
MALRPPIGHRAREQTAMVPARMNPATLPAVALALGLGLSAALAQAPQPGVTVGTYLAAAKAAAGFDFTGTLARICINPQTAPGGDRARGNPPPRETWFTEPAKVFDNLYFVGSKIHSAWALTTSEGIILIDTLYDYASEELIPNGLKKLGLDPANVKYTLISHGHGDHVGGALMMQEKYKSRIVMGDKDWTLVNSYVLSFPNGSPKRDIVAQDGDKITLGDGSVTLISTPGHTPDTYSFIFQVKDNGKPLTVAYNGGTAFNFVNDVPHFDIYIASQKKMAKAAADAGATVLLTNHSEFDNAVTKIRMLAARKEGEPSPFEAGANAVARYFKVTENCAQAARLRLVNGTKD